MRGSRNFSVGPRDTFVIHEVECSKPIFIISLTFEFT